MSPEVKIQAVLIRMSVLVWMKGRNQAPISRGTVLLPGGGKLGLFWRNCKRWMKCGRPPYDRLLTNPVLRADYRAHLSSTRER